MNGYPDGELWTGIPGDVRKHLESQWDQARARHGTPTVLFSTVHTVDDGPGQPGRVVYTGIVAAQVVSVRRAVDETVTALRVRNTVHAPGGGPSTTSLVYTARERVYDVTVNGRTREVARLYGYDQHQIARIGHRMFTAAQKDFPPWRGVSRVGWDRGPWDNEGDRETFITANGHAALLLRNHVGAWCGYIAVPVRHPWHGKRGSELHLVNGREVTYGDDNKLDRGPVHVGEDLAAWVIGFHMSEGGDITPAPRTHHEHYHGAAYRTIDDARDHTEELSVAAAYGPQARLRDRR